jgi:outer membrane murein-binding lipoprotein Lpp
MKALFAIAAVVTLAGPVYADCSYPPPPAKLPDGATATMEQMLEAKKAVTQYNKDINAYVACIKLEHETAVTNAGDKMTPEQKAEMEKMEVQKNNAAVDQLQSVADRFNEQVRAYKTAHDPNGSSSSDSKKKKG